MPKYSNFTQSLKRTYEFDGESKDGWFIPFYILKVDSLEEPESFEVWWDRVIDMRDYALESRTS